MGYSQQPISIAWHNSEETGLCHRRVKYQHKKSLKYVSLIYPTQSLSAGFTCRKMILGPQIHVGYFCRVVLTSKISYWDKTSGGHDANSKNIFKNDNFLS